MTRRWFAIGVFALVALGCTGGVQQDAQPTVKDDGVFKVALLTPGSISDSGWNAMAFAGLMAIQKELKCDVENREATDAQIKDAMRSYAQKDFDLIIGHGYEYNEPGVEMAKEFPSTVFVSSSGSKTSANAGAFRFYLEQGFYLCGYMAGSMSKSGVVAAIGYNTIPSIKSTFRAFEAGAKAANPKVRVIEPTMSDKADISAMKLATLAAIREGADFVIHQANDAAQGVFDACMEKGAHAFGANLDQNSNQSRAVVASAFIVAKPAYVELAKEVKAGTYKGTVTLKGMADGVIQFAISPLFVDSVPAFLQKRLADLQKNIANGTIVVPKDEF